MSKASKNAYLILENGRVFKGKQIGAEKEVVTEIVFNTSMTGYAEVLTDPSYAGQGVVMTYPLIGSVGVCYDDLESGRAQVDAFIVHQLTECPSNFRCDVTLGEYLENEGVPGIEGVDTRALTKTIRENGAMNGMITTDESFDLERTLIR
ncbi:MAG: carbamoyl phosphate synthase small subunit, partial [Clostridiales bacterium]|nr:carbamoyl phosphate synthase small subunit [Clostridiales bacterium]